MELFARTCKMEQMNVQRIAARGFVLVGALFWGFAAGGAQWAYRGAPFTEALAYALMYAGAILAVFVLSLFLEQLAAWVLGIGSVAVVVLGIVGGWETGVWAVMIFFFILPLLLASVLYFMAARMQKICELQ